MTTINHNVCRHQQGHVGIIMLETNFPRLYGDIGNADSFIFRTSYRKVKGAKVEKVVTEKGVSEEIKKSIVEAALELQEEGVDLIVTSCGFLGEMQRVLEQSLSVPIVSSSLVVIPFVSAVVGCDQVVAVLTFDSTKLNSKHFNGNYSKNIKIFGIEKGDELHKVIQNDLAELDYKKAEQDIVEVSRDILKKHPRAKAIILECTNLSPYKDAIRIETGLPVFDLMQVIHWFLEAKYG